MQSEEIGELIKAIGAVMADVGYVRGTGQNTHHRYSYTSDEDLAAAVQPALVRHGVALLPVACHVERTGDRTIINQTWRVAHTSGQWSQLEIAGEGIDKQDKGVAKSLTGARKYLCRLLFCIPTGDDIEREAEVAQSNSAAEDFTPFISELLDRVETLQLRGTSHAGPAAAKILQVARAGMGDTAERQSLAKIVAWADAADAPEA